MTAARTVPFAEQSITTEVLSTQLYILVATLTTLSIGAAVSARRRAGVELVQTQQRAAERAEQERQRIARDLHDSVSQTLFSLGLHAGIAKHEAGRAEVPTGSALPEAIAEMAALAQAALLEMRASIFDLRGGAIAEQGMVTALAAHGAALNVRHDVRVTVTGPEDRLPLSPRTEELLYRIGQEAITNAVKHSGSEAVSAQVSADGSLVTLTVCDHGSGFDPDSSYAGHLGLGLMRSRALETGGTVEVTSTPGGGTTVRAAVPADTRPASGMAGLPGPRGQLAGPPGSGM
jgi:signal transduction histidine kinase